MFLDNKNPKISVLLTIYNNQATIEKCLNSIINQDMDEFELICIDDGSRDRSLDILSIFAEKYDNISVHIQEEHLGIAKTRNNLLNMASGQFVVFIDAKDWYPAKDILSTLYKNAQKKEVKVCGGSFICYLNGEYTINFSENLSGYSFTKDNLYTYKEYQFDFGFQRFIYDRNFLIENNLYFPDDSSFEDVVFFVNTMYKAEVFYGIKKITYCYRGEKTSNLPYKEEEALDILGAISTILNISSQYHLPKLHLLWVNRYKEYSIRIFKNCMGSPDRLFDKLSSLSHSIDHQLLKEITVDWDTDYIFETFANFQFAENCKLRNKQNSLNQSIKELLKKNSLLEKQNKDLDQKLKKTIAERETYKKVSQGKINASSVQNEDYVQILQKEIENIRSSTTFKIGRFFMYIPSNIKDKYLMKKENK